MIGIINSQAAAYKEKAIDIRSKMDDLAFEHFKANASECDFFKKVTNFHYILRFTYNNLKVPSFSGGFLRSLYSSDGIEKHSQFDGFIYRQRGN